MAMKWSLAAAPNSCGSDGHSSPAKKGRNGKAQTGRQSTLKVRGFKHAVQCQKQVVKRKKCVKICQTSGEIWESCNPWRKLGEGNDKRESPRKNDGVGKHVVEGKCFVRVEAVVFFLAAVHARAELVHTHSLFDHSASWLVYNLSDCICT